MRSLLILSILFFIASPSFALKDIPKNHWASREAETWAERGWIRIFPDKTFRGNTAFTRYEAAETFGKILRELYPAMSLQQKILAELQREKADTAWEISDIRSSFTASGKAFLSGDVGWTPSSLASRRHMRLQYHLDWVPNEDREVQVHLDTRDAGWGGGTARNSIRDFFEWHWKERFFMRDQEVTIMADMGPEDIYQTAPSPEFPQYQDAILLGHNPKVSVGSNLFGSSVIAGAQVHGLAPSGTSDFQSVFLQIPGGQWVLTADGSRFQFLLPHIRLWEISLQNEVWTSGPNIDEMGWAMSSLWGEREKDFIELRVIQSGRSFRKRPDEAIEWLPYSPGGMAAQNGASIYIAEWGIGSFLPVSLKWKSEWLTTPTNLIQLHEGTFSRKVSQDVQVELGASYFESGDGTSWRGVALPTSQGWLAHTSIHLDMPTWHF